LEARLRSQSYLNRGPFQFPATPEEEQDQEFCEREGPEISFRVVMELPGLMTQKNQTAVAEFVRIPPRLFGLRVSSD
jgi:hypothetical protein